MQIYLFIYLILLLIAFADFKKFPQKDKIFLLIVLVVIFTLFRGLRWQTGTDWGQYLSVYNNASLKNIFSYNRYSTGTHYMEFGYMILNVLMKPFNHYSVFLLVTNFAILINFVVISLTISPKYPLLTFAFLVVSFTFFPVRQDFAIALILWGFFAIYKKNIKQFVLFVFLGFTIHYSALLLLPLYFILNFKFKPIIIVFIYLFLTLFFSFIPLESVLSYLANLRIMPLSISILINQYNGVGSEILYKASSAIKIGSLFQHVYAICFLYFFAISRDKIKDVEQASLLNVFLNIYLIFCLIQVISRLDVAAILSRFAMFFYCGFPLAFAIVYSNSNKKIRQILGILFFLLFSYKLYKLFHSGFSDLFFPYYSIFQNEIPIRSVFY